LRKDPSNFDALFSLGRFYKARRRNWSKSEQCYQEALKVRPQDTNALCSYGALLSELTPTNPHILSQAADCFQQVLALEPSHFEATYNYAVLLGKWERTLSTDGDFAQREVHHPNECTVLHLHLFQNQGEIRESHHELPLDAISTSANRRLLAVQLYRKVVRSLFAACEVLVRVNQTYYMGALIRHWR
jgi:tetratricopeptide (TPR) repeat protein